MSPSRYRTYDGTCNHLTDVLRGATNTKMDRMLDALYKDDAGEPYGSSAFNFRADQDVVGTECPEEARKLKKDTDDSIAQSRSGQDVPVICEEKTFPNQLPEPRMISKNFHRDMDDADPEISLMLMQFGQFLDHDITLTPEAHADVDCCEATEEVINNNDCLSIALPPGDSFGTNFNLTCLEFRRSTAFCLEDESVREQFDIISQFVDASNIYGSAPTVSCQLRSDADGLLLSQTTSEGSQYLPTLAVKDGDPARLTSGDIRALEMPGLASMHTLWLREHNGIANTIKENTEGLTNDEIFQEARRILIAEYQHVIYAEFLLAVLGSVQIAEYELGTERSTYKDGDESDYRPVIFNEFATAAYRFGHTLIQGTVIPQEPSDKTELEGYMLRDVFFNDDQVRRLK